LRRAEPRASPAKTLCFGIVSAASSPVPFDAAAFLRRIGDDRALAGAMAALFLELCPALLDAVRQAVHHRDAVALAQAAHALKGSVGNFGATTATDAAAQLETIGQRGDVAAASDVLRDLETALEQLSPALRELMP
jgi:two-component system sensor histidine kinase/response regulator